MDAVRALLGAYSGTASMSDSNARTPLHLACVQQSPSAELVQILVSAFPAACKQRDYEHTIPIQIAHHKVGGNASLQLESIMAILSDAWPESKDFLK